MLLVLWLWKLLIVKEEWLEQLLAYISDNFDFVRSYCKEYIPEIKPNLPDAMYFYVSLIAAIFI